MQNPDNITHLILSLCRILRIPHIKKEVLSLVQAHPFFPSLATLVDVLKDLGINAEAYKFDYNDLLNLKKHSIVHLKIDEGIFARIVKVSNEQVVYTVDEQKYETVKKVTFCDLWDNIILIVDYGKNYNRIKYFLSRLKDNRLSILLLFLFLSFTLVLGSQQIMHNLNQEFWGLILTKFIGLSFLWLMIKHEIGESNPLLDKICKSNKFSDCNSVLNSKGSLIFGLFKLSDIGLIWFVSSALYLLYTPNSSSEFFFPIEILTICTIPFIIYSIFYQFLYIKKMCPLCMGVITMLILDLFNILSFINIESINVNHAINYFLILISIILMSIVFWTILYESILIKNRNFTLWMEHSRNVSSPKYILDAIEQSEDITLEAGIISPLKITSNNSQIIITEIISLYCSPCKESLLKIRKIVDYLGDDSPDFQVIIHCNSKEISEYNTRAELHLIAIASENDPAKTMHALSLWFELMNYEKWSELFPVTINRTSVNILQNQNAWIKSNKIKGTPTAYLNNKLIPYEINIENIKYIFV